MNIENILSHQVKHININIKLQCHIGCGVCRDSSLQCPPDTVGPDASVQLWRPTQSQAATVRCGQPCVLYKHNSEQHANKPPTHVSTAINNTSQSLSPLPLSQSSCPESVARGRHTRRTQLWGQPAEHRAATRASVVARPSRMTTQPRRRNPHLRPLRFCSTP